MFLAIVADGKDMCIDMCAKLTAVSIDVWACLQTCVCFVFVFAWDAD